MWDLDHKEGWVLKNWCFPTEVVEKTLGSLLDSKEVKPVNPKGNQQWVFIGWTDAEVSTVWPPDENSRFTGKDPDARNDWEQEEKGTTEDEVVDGIRVNGHEFWKPQQIVKDREVWCAEVHRLVKSWTQLSDWKTTIVTYFFNIFFLSYNNAMTFC